MIHLHNNCIIFNDYIEETALAQIYNFLDHPAFKNKQVRFMSDVHAGKGAVIGTTVPLSNKVIPNVIGVDQCCGVLTYNIGKANIDLSELDDIIYNNIPSGYNVNSEIKFNDRKLKDKIMFTCECFLKESPERHLLSVGSLGGGNHFIELGIDDNKDKWLTVHSGSRNFGLKLALFYQKMAKQHIKDNNIKVMKDMEYLEGEAIDAYLTEHNTTKEFTSMNRKVILDTIIEKLNLDVYDKIESIHNYIGKDNIIRKGAISAYKNEKVVIPWNMRDGIILGVGKGNKDWNFSAPHGAGRVMSRSKAKKTISLDEFKDSMNGIYSTSICESTIDESPFTYKNPNDIERYIKDTVEITHRVKTLYNFKAK